MPYLQSQTVPYQSSRKHISRAHRPSHYGRGPCRAHAPQPRDRARSIPSTPVGHLLTRVLATTARNAARLSHFLLERNRPASFRSPFYSVIADFRMSYEILTRRRPLDERPRTSTFNPENGS
jgi:hypothetical protein